MRSGNPHSDCHEKPLIRGWHNAAGTLAAASGDARQARSKGILHPCRMFLVKKAPKPGAFRYSAEDPALAKLLVRKSGMWSPMPITVLSSRRTGSRR